MPRLLTPAELDERDDADGDRDAAFRAIPERLRPSAWRAWLDSIGAEPDPSRDDEVAAAYGMTVDQLVTTSPGAPSAHWRQIVADERHRADYLAWLTEHGRTYEAEVTGERHPLPGWRFGDVERWERQA